MEQLPGGGIKAACSVKDHALPLESWLSGNLGRQQWWMREYCINIYIYIWYTGFHQVGVKFVPLNHISSQEPKIYPSLNVKAWWALQTACLTRTSKIKQGPGSGVLWFPFLRRSTVKLNPQSNQSTLSMQLFVKPGHSSKKSTASLISWIRKIDTLGSLWSISEYHLVEDGFHQP